MSRPRVALPPEVASLPSWSLGSEVYRHGVVLTLRGARRAIARPGIAFFADALPRPQNDGGSL